MRNFESASSAGTLRSSPKKNSVFAQSICCRNPRAVKIWYSSRGVEPPAKATKNFPWSSSSDVIQRSYDKMDASFEFISKLGLEYFCFHDFDLVEESKSFNESEKRLSKIVEYGKKKLESSDLIPNIPLERRCPLPEFPFIRPFWTLRYFVFLGCNIFFYFKNYFLRLFLGLERPPRSPFLDKPIRGDNSRFPYTSPFMIQTLIPKRP